MRFHSEVDIEVPQVGVVLDQIEVGVRVASFEILDQIRVAVFEKFGPNSGLPFSTFLDQFQG